MGQLVVLLLFLGVMYFVLIRPQQKQQKQRNQMLQLMQVGDDVVTIGGLHGEVVAMDEVGENPTVDLLVTDDVVLRFRRSAIAEVKGALTESGELVERDESAETDEDDGSVADT